MTGAYRIDKRFKIEVGRWVRLIPLRFLPKQRKHVSQPYIKRNKCLVSKIDDEIQLIFLSR